MKKYILSLIFLSTAFLGCSQANVNQSTISLIPLQKTCDLEKTALPITTSCPANNIVSDIEKYNGTFTINSPEGSANIRSDGSFNENSSTNILTVLPDKQQFCGTGPVKAYFDAQGGHEPAQPDTAGPLAYQVLLKDSNNQYCNGYVSLTLVKE